MFSKHGVAFFVIARDFIAIHLSKPASSALKYFEPIVQYLKIEKCFCVCAHRQCFCYELGAIIAFRARQCDWSVIPLCVFNCRRNVKVGSTAAKLLLATTLGAFTAKAAIATPTFHFSLFVL